MDQNIVKRCNEVLQKGSLIINEAMWQHTTFHIGGPADLFAEPGDFLELQELLKICQQEAVPYYIIGNGSNLLVGDKGYRGMIILLGDLFSQLEISRESDLVRVVAGSGIKLSKLVNTMADNRLGGLEFAGGIPGTLGGAITMNAGAYGGEIKNCIVEADVLTPQGTLLTLSKDELLLGYRDSIIARKQYAVINGTFLLAEGSREEIKARIAELNRQRREKQPLEFPSAGSTFKRPEGYYAGKLIMDAGLRGYRVGNIMISEKHCGFVINTGEGTAAQVRQLIEDVRQKVLAHAGILLEPEVRFLGEF